MLEIQVLAWDMLKKSFWLVSCKWIFIPNLFVYLCIDNFFNYHKVSGETYI